MIKNSLDTLKKRHTLLWLAMLGLMVLWLVWYLNIYLTDTLNPTLYTTAVTLLFAFTLYFRAGEMTTEEKLLLGYEGWYIISRFFHGTRCFFDEYHTIVIFTLFFSFTAGCFVLDRKQRVRLLKAVCLLAVLYITALSLFSIYTSIGMRDLVNPITEKSLISWESNRVVIFGTTSNTAGQMFLAGILCAVLLFVYSSFTVTKIVCVLAGIINYLSLTLTSSRTSMLAFSLAAALCVSCVITHNTRKKKPLVRLAACFAAFIVIVPLGYKSFNLSAGIFSTANELVTADAPAQEQGTPTDDNDNKPVFEGTKDYYVGSGRMLAGREEIYKAVSILLKEEPVRLAIGSRLNDRLTYVNKYMNRDYGVLHNSFLEALVLFGLPGLAIVLAYTVLVIIKAVKTVFSRDERVTLATRMLTVPMLALYACSLGESLLFYMTDFQGVLYFLSSGILLANCREKE